MLVLPLHIHTLLKTNIFPFFPQVYVNNFEKCAKTPKKKVGEGGGGGYNSPLWPRYHPIWFKTSTLKDNCLFKLLLGKKGKKTNISQFLASHAYIKLTFVSFFFLFFCAPFLYFLCLFVAHYIAST